MNRFRIGVLTPSSNTALEPLTTQILMSLPEVTAHFGRFRVTEIALSDKSQGQFDDSQILNAADLLTDANPSVLVWSGTSAGWLGFEKDRNLCQRITEQTGVPASTAILSLNELLMLRGVRRLGIVSPYTGDVQQRIIDQYASLGIEVVAEVHHNIVVNYDFAKLSSEQIREDLVKVAAAKPEAVVTYCTNLRAAQLADSFEAETGITLLDTVSTSVWGAMRELGLDASKIRGWGRLFQWS